MKRISAIVALLAYLASPALAGYISLLGAGSGSSSAPAPGTFAVGATLSGMESSFPVVPSASEITYLASKHFRFFRLPIQWSGTNAQLGGPTGIQPTVNGALDTTSTYLGAGGYLGAIDTVIASASLSGMTVILDIHGFGGTCPASDGSGQVIVGSGLCPISQFADLWSKVSTHYKGNPVIRGYDLMNEWVNGFDSATVFAANQAAINAIRATGDTAPIYVEGTNFSGAWNWVTGQGQPFNNANLFQLVDPANNLVFSAHSYLDRDSSGTHFIWSVESTTPGLSPPPIPTSPTIGTTRLMPFAQWCAQHQVRCHLGETATSNDPIELGGVSNSASWNQTLQNELEFAQANNIEVNIWGAGPGFGPATPLAGYPFNYEPSSVGNPLAKDFTTVGLQSTQMVVLDKFTGFAGPQPLAYSLSLPINGSFNPVRYGTQGVASGPFTVAYNAKIVAPIVVTPRALLMDGTSGGGTFTPSSLTLSPGDNAITTFTYTPASATTFQISTTNNAGLIDPPAIGFSSQQDAYRNLTVVPTNEYGLYLRYTASIRPLVRIQRSADNTQEDVFANNANGIDRLAVQTWASARSGIQVVIIYDQSPFLNDITFTPSANVTLNLSNAQDYPEIVVLSGAQGEFNTPINNQTALSSLMRINQSSSASLGLYRMDWFVGPIALSPTQYSLNNLGTGGGSAALDFGEENDIYHEYGMSYASGVTNGFVTYKDTTQVAQTTFTATMLPAFGNSQIEFAWFKFAGSIHWAGSLTNFEILEGIALSPAQITSITGFDTTYYSTPLPPLSTVAPTISGTGPHNTISNKQSTPFTGATILDTNSGSPTDTVTITLTGTAGGTLSGTGLSGSGPYTMGPAPAATITTQLNALLYTTSASPAATETMALNVVSSAGPSSSDSHTVVTIIAVAPAETPFPAPSGTFMPRNLSGVNISGGEQPYPSASGGCTPNCSYNYSYPQNQEIDYWSSKGFGMIRMPTQTRRLQQFSYGALDPAGRTDEPPNAYRVFSAGSQTNLLSIKAVLDRARADGMHVMLDLHNFGTIFDTLANTNRTIGADAEATNQFVDIWTRLATKFKNYDNIVWNIENEPVGMTVAQWKTAAVATINAIASVTTTQAIFVPGGANFTGAHDWIGSGNGAAWAGYVPPVGMPFYFDMHEYLDSDFSGTHAVCVQTTSVMDAATSWARTNGYKVFIGESGWSQDTSCPPLATSLFSYLTTNNDVYHGYAYWVGGNSLFYGAWNVGGAYIYSAVPAGYPAGPFTDAPQQTIMHNNILNFLLKRDIDPSSNDNSPMWLEKAA